MIESHGLFLMSVIIQEEGKMRQSTQVNTHF